MQMAPNLAGLCSRRPRYWRFTAAGGRSRWARSFVIVTPSIGALCQYARTLTAGGPPGLPAEPNGALAGQTQITWPAPKTGNN